MLPASLLMSATNGSSPPATTAEWLHRICSTRVVPERGKPITKMGCAVSGRCFACGSSPTFSRVKNCLQRSNSESTASAWYSVPGDSFSSFVLPATKSCPAPLMVAEPVMPPPAGEVPLAAERACRVENRQRLAGPAHSRQRVGAQQIDFGGRGGRLGKVEQLSGALEVAPGLIQGRQVGEGFHILGCKLMRPGEKAVRLFYPALFHQVEAEVHENGSLGTGKLYGAAKVPLARGQIVHLGQNGAEQIVGVGVARVGPKRRAGHLLGIPRLAMSHEQLNELVVGPVGALIDSNDRVQRPRSLTELAAALLHDEPKLEGVDVPPSGLQ